MWLYSAVLFHGRVCGLPEVSHKSLHLAKKIKKILKMRYNLLSRSFGRFCYLLDRATLSASPYFLQTEASYFPKCSFNGYVFYLDRE